MLNGFETTVRPRWLEKPRVRNSVLTAWVCINALVTVWLLARTGFFLPSGIPPPEQEDIHITAQESHASVIATSQPPLDIGCLPTTEDENDAIAECAGLAPPTSAATTSDTPRPGPIDHQVASPASPASLAGLSSAPEAVYGDKVAVVIETRMMPNLVPVMLHFASVLGPAWTVVLFTLEAEFAMPSSAPFLRAVAAGRVRVAYLPDDTDFSTHHAVSVFLTRPWLWAQLATAQRALLFQTDSILCARANVSVDDFLQWDLIGAPIAPGLGHGYNGGLSLRNPRMLLAVTSDATIDFEADAATGGGQPELNFEDQWFYGQLVKRGDARLPPPEVAMTFAVETVYYEAPLGYHQPQRWQPDRMDEIMRHCPEVGMLIGNRFGF